MGSAPEPKRCRSHTTVGSIGPRKVERDGPSGAWLFLPGGDSGARSEEGAGIVLPSPWRGPTLGRDQQSGGGGVSHQEDSPVLFVTPPPTPVSRAGPLRCLRRGPYRLPTSPESPALSTGPQVPLRIASVPPGAPAGRGHGDGLRPHVDHHHHPLCPGAAAVSPPRTRLLLSACDGRCDAITKNEPMAQKRFRRAATWSTPGAQGDRGATSARTARHVPQKQPEDVRPSRWR